MIWGCRPDRRLLAAATSLGAVDMRLCLTGRLPGLSFGVAAVPPECPARRRRRPELVVAWPSVEGGGWGGAMMTNPGPRHVPVLRDEVVDHLVHGRANRDPLRILDLTLGLGGHAEALLEAAPAGSVLLGLDRDRAALDLARVRLAPFGEAVTTVQSPFSNLAAALAAQGWSTVDAVVADLGVSSLQLDEPGRGFSFRFDAPLDMRMDPDGGGETAAELIERLDEAELADILHDLGEERAARRIARTIKNAAHSPATTGELRALVARHVRGRPGHDPATRTFQALRIAVNQELEEIAGMLAALPGILAPRARLAVLAWHSLEDRIVKTVFRNWCATCVCPPQWPMCRCRGVPRATRLTRGAVRPTEGEVGRNPRARSARLRVVEWCGGG